MLRQLKRNKQGVVFITILTVILGLMILLVGFMSLNVSQVMITEKEIDSIQAEIVGLGALGRALVSQMSATPANLITYNQMIGQKTFDIIITRDTSGGGISGTDMLSVTVDY